MNQYRNCKNMNESQFFWYFVYLCDLCHLDKEKSYNEWWISCDIIILTLTDIYWFAFLKVVHKYPWSKSHHVLVLESERGTNQ